MSDLEDLGEDVDRFMAPKINLGKPHRRQSPKVREAVDARMAKREAGRLERIRLSYGVKHGVTGQVTLRKFSWEG